MLHITILERHEKIRELRQAGALLKDIAKEVGVHVSTVEYALYPHRRQAHSEWGKVRQKLKHPLSLKINTFRGRRKDKSQSFSKDDLLKKTGGAVCYLTGTSLDLSSGKSYEIDHVLPRSRGGKCSLDNAALTLASVNRAKANLTVDEFIGLCQKVLEHNGYVVTRKT